MILYTRSEKGRYSEAPDDLVIAEAMRRMQERGMTTVTQKLTRELARAAMLRHEVSIEGPKMPRDPFPTEEKS